MRTAYARLFTVRLRHGFYRSKRSEGDFVVTPSSDTATTLRDLGLRFLPREDGFTVYAEVDPATRFDEVDGPKLARLDGEETLRLRFYLRPVSAYLTNFTSLPAHRPGAEVFYFDNLEFEREDEAGGLQLTDSVAGGRFGPPLELVASREYRYRFDAPVDSATLTVTDMFGQTVFTHAVRHPEESREALLDLGALEDEAGGGIRALAPGRYEVADDHAGSRWIFYDPGFFGTSPLGVVEIFTSTVGLIEGDDTSEVPTKYRVFKDDRIRGVDDFNIQFEARETTWRYRVTRKYEPEDGRIDPATLSIDDAVFDGDVDAADPPRTTFTSKDPRPLSEVPASFVLKHDGKKIRTLPNPRPDAPLKTETDGQKKLTVSEVFIYV